MKKRLLILFMSFALFAACSDDSSSTSAGKSKNNGSEVAEFHPFYRIDRDNVNEWQEPLDNQRYLTAGTYELKAVDEKYDLDPAYAPSEEGLATLDISGSAQFSELQFRDLAESIRALAGDKKVYIIDCRSESHALVNGIAISYFEQHNWGNQGLTLEEVEADEQERFGKMVGTEQTFNEKDGESPGEAMTLKVKSIMMERELVESEGFEYKRFVALNNHWQEPEMIDEFIEFVKGLDMDKVWLHFHCQAGKGRTAIFMVIYDMMKNPDVSMRDIVIRQAKAGGNYLLYTEKSDHYKSPLFDDIAEKVQLLYMYIQENRKSNYKVKWREWLKKDVTTLTTTVSDEGSVTKDGDLNFDMSADSFLKTFDYGDVVTVLVVGYGTVDVPVAANDDDVDAGEFVLLVKKGSDKITLGIKGGNAASVLGIGDKVHYPLSIVIRMKEKGGNDQK